MYSVHNNSFLIFAFIFLLCGLEKHRSDCRVSGAAVKAENDILDLQEMQRKGGGRTCSTFSSPLSSKKKNLWFLSDV